MSMLIGDYILLRPMREDDATNLFESANDKKIWEYTSKKVYTYDEMVEVVKAALISYEKGIELPFVIERRTDGKVLGSTRFTNIDKENGSLEIGWTWLHPSVWRTVVNTEAKRLLLAHAFETLGIRRVQFCVDSRNERSQRAVSRLGAVQEGILRKHRIVAEGYIRDTVVFSILANEWDAVKRNLEIEPPPVLFGKVLDEMSRCEHYHQEVDVISLRFKCCDRFYPCHDCHAETTTHEPVLWSADEHDEKVVCCGSCKQTFSINQYMSAESECPVCGVRWNPGCKSHAHLYWEE